LLKKFSYFFLFDILRWIRTLFFVPNKIIRDWRRLHSLQYRYPNMYISFPCVLRYDNIAAIQIGAQVNIESFAEIIVDSRSSHTSVPGALIIGDRVVIGSHANIRACGGTISIGKDTLIAQNVSIIAANHIISDRQPYRDLPWDMAKVGVEIGENVWLGAGVTVLPGCCIGNNAVVGAGSVVTKSIPGNEIWVGIPAKKLRNV
jgi:acetyltransferase-like isoleucine patch superfamily enzyme